MDRWRFKGDGAVSWQEVLWTDSTGRTLIIDSPPGADPAGRPIRHAIAPVTGVLTGGEFTPLPGNPQNILKIAW